MSEADETLADVWGLWHTGWCLRPMTHRLMSEADDTPADVWGLWHTGWCLRLMTHQLFVWTVLLSLLTESQLEYWNWQLLTLNWLLYFTQNEMFCIIYWPECLYFFFTPKCLFKCLLIRMFVKCFYLRKWYKLLHNCLVDVLFVYFTMIVHHIDRCLSLPLLLFLCDLLFIIIVLLICSYCSYRVRCSLCDKHCGTLCVTLCLVVFASIVDIYWK